MLSPEKIAESDSLRVVQDYDAWPSESSRAARLDPTIPRIHEIKALILTGMGGSGAAADIIRDWLSKTVSIPIWVVKDYHLPPFLPPSTLVIATSSSGDTEETLGVMDEALSRRLAVCTISGGGRLEAASQTWKVPHTRIRPLGTPRTSFPVLFFATLAVLRKLGLLGKQENEVESTLRTLNEVGLDVRSTVEAARNPSKQLAVALQNRLPIIYASPAFRGVGNRFKSSLNENAKVHAVAEELPELCHNSIVAWAYPMPIARTPVLMRAPEEAEEVRERLHALEELLHGYGYQPHSLSGRGDCLLAHLLSVLYVSDAATAYLALLRGIDPGPTEPIDRLKEVLETRLQYVGRRTKLGAS